jgi:outer membrane protein TolC
VTQRFLVNVRSSLTMFLRVLAAAGTAMLSVAMPAASAQSTDTLLLDLPGAVARAMRMSDETRLAALSLDAASASLTTARASIFPQITFNSAYTQTVRNARAAIVGSVFGQSYTYQATVNVTQTLFQGGRAFYGWRSATHARQASQFDAQESRALLQVDVQRAYLDVLFATRMVTIQRNGLSLARERVAQVEQFSTAGRASRYDLLSARVAATNFEPVVLQAVNNRALAELELRRVLNIPATQPIKLTTELDAGSAQSIVALVSDATQESPANRALLKAAELTYRARRDAVNASHAGFLPTISMFLRTGFLALPTEPGVPWGVGRRAEEFCPSGASATAICQNNGWFRDESFGLNVSWPIFDGLRAKGEMQLASAQAHIAELQWRLREEQVAIEVASARAEFERARASFEAQRTNAGEATEAFQLASLRFSRGLGTQLEVSDAQLALLTSQSNEARSVYELHLAAAELARALGRPIPVPTGVVPRSTSGN